MILEGGRWSQRQCWTDPRSLRAQHAWQTPHAWREISTTPTGLRSVSKSSFTECSSLL